jgi:IS605 OrfB family transposase
MKLTITVKLQPTPDQAAALLATLEQANAAANTISQTAWATHSFGQFALHRLVYAPTRAATGLAAQVVVRLIAKVADSYKANHAKLRHFRPHGSIAYDRRILRWSPTAISIWTVAGRQRIPFVADARAHVLLTHPLGESDLMYRDGTWYLATTVEIPTPPVTPNQDWVGVDLGLVNLAVDSDGRVYSGAQVRGLRRRHSRLRAKLQAKGTRAAKRLLRKRRRKEHRFATQVNHTLSKQLVAQAQGTQRGIALEDLKGIRARITVKKAQRRELHSWAFRQLREFILYKACRAGVRMVLVDPRNTSRTCPQCGHCAKENRKSQSQFLCVACHFAGLADHIAAENIRRAAVNQPHSAVGFSDPAS